MDETGEPVIGANVLVKGTTNGQITDLNGGFSIKVEHASATLLVSYVGYVRQEVKATSGKILKIVLVPDANMKEEVVVTGYGTFKKYAYAGSAASVKNEKIADVPSVSFQDLLQGNATGVQFTSASRPPSELMEFIEPEVTGTPSITYSGELEALKEPIPRILKEAEE